MQPDFLGGFFVVNRPIVSAPSVKSFVIQ
ncbi:hypothetical protein LCGC14_1995930, partial [marine sediment metagenome]